MEEKVLHFEEMAKHTDEVLNPRDSILKNLPSVSADILEEYVGCMTSFAEELFLLRSIVLARDNPHLFRHLLDGLAEDQVIKLNKIVLNLAAKDPFEKVDELTELTFNVAFPTEESRSRATALISLIKSFDIDYDLKAKELAIIAWQIRLLSNICIALSLGQEFGDLMVDRLSFVTTADLDRMIRIGNTKMVKEQ